MSDNESIRDITINHIYPPDTETRYANNFVIQHDSDSFFLSFFDIWSPIILGATDEERKKQAEAIDHIDARCVARITLSPNRMRELLRLMLQNLENYEQKQGQVDPLEQDE